MRCAFFPGAPRFVAASGLLILAGTLPGAAVAQSDCRVVAGLPEAYAQLAQTELHAVPPVHPDFRIPDRPDARASADPTVATHGQLMFGQSILYHLPVFMTDPWSHPHNFQVALEVALSDDARAAIAADQAAHPDSIYTAVPPVSRRLRWSSTCRASAQGRVRAAGRLSQPFRARACRDRPYTGAHRTRAALP